MPRQLSANALVTIACDDERRVVTLVRSSEPAISAEVLVGAYDSGIDAAIAALGESSGYGFVIDVRAAPGRNDAGFEDALPRLHKKLGQHFVAVVTLVRTSIGALQVRRVARQRGLSDLLAQTEEQAYALCHPDKES